MGGFSLNLPGQAQEPISGDSLTQYLRSLTNQGGAAYPQFLQQGGQQTGTGFGTLGTALDTTKGALGTTQPAVDYWKAILSGDPTALTAATAPTANALSQIYSGATNNANTNLPSGGFRGATLAQLPQAQAGQVGNYLLGLQPTAAQNLNTLAGTQAGIAGTQAGIGATQGQIGLGEQGIGTNLYQILINSLLNRRGQNVTETGNTLSFVGDLAKAASQGAAAAVNPSDIDLKAGLLPLGIVDGVPVYAWRYKATGKLAMGVVAQEVQEIVPEAVTIGTDGFLRVNYDMLFRTLRLAEAA